MNKITNSSYQHNKKVKLIPCGGVSGVTKNLFIYEQKGDILVVDCGVGFPDEPGEEQELLYPDFSYLLKNRSKIRGLFVTHAHFDHYGAVPKLLKRINMPVYSTRLTKEFILRKARESGLKEKDIDFNIVNHKSNSLKIGSFEIVPIHVNHSVPQTLGIMIRTKAGNIFHISDYKFDWTPVDEKPFDVQKICLLAAEKKPLLLLSDCLGAANPGHTESERTIQQVLENIILRSEKKVLVTTISSNISRIKQAVRAAVNAGRKVSFVGRSIEASGEVARKLGYLKGLKKYLVSNKKIKKMPDNKKCLIVAGSYGQPNSSLTRVSQKKHHLVKLKKNDTVIFSADPAPPQVFVDVNRVIDNLNRLGANVYYYEIQNNLHVSGHGTSEDVKALMAMVRPKLLMPIGGDYRHMWAYKMLAQKMGWKEGEVLLLDEGKELVLGEGERYTIN